MMPAAGGFQDQIVLSLGNGKRLAVLGMEIACDVGGPIVEAVIDVEVTVVHRFAALVGQRDAGPVGERHRPVAVERLDAADGDGRTLVLDIAAETQAEKVPQRALHRRLAGAVPIDPQYQLAQVIGGLGVDGEPDMGNLAVALGPAEFQRRPGAMDRESPFLNLGSVLANRYARKGFGWARCSGTCACAVAVVMTSSARRPTTDRFALVIVLSRLG